MPGKCRALVLEESLEVDLREVVAAACALLNRSSFVLRDRLEPQARPMKRNRVALPVVKGANRSRSGLVVKDGEVGHPSARVVEVARIPPCTFGAQRVKERASQKRLPIIDGLRVFLGLISLGHRHTKSLRDVAEFSRNAKSQLNVNPHADQAPRLPQRAARSICRLLH